MATPKMAVKPESIRILHLITQYQLRGAERFASQLSGVLASRGSRSYLCSIYGPGPDGFPIPAQVDFLSIGARQTGPTAWLGIQPSILIKMVSIFRKTRPDVVFAHGSDTMKYAALAGRFYPRVSIIYENIGTASYWAKGGFKKWANKRLLKRVDAVVSVSQASREDFRKVYRFPPDKISAITNAIDATGFRRLEISRERTRARQELGLKDTDLVAVTVGSLSYEKNQDELLTLLHELKDDSAHLVLIGDGPLRQTMESRADALRIGDRVHFLGVQTNIIPYLSASDIFLLPSRSEGMPGVLIEAGMSGLPSVAYDVGGVREVIEPDITGIIVPKNDFSRFKTAVVSLLADSSRRRQMGLEARRRCLASFDIENVAGEYEILIYKLLENKAAR